MPKCCYWQRERGGGGEGVGNKPRLVLLDIHGHCMYH